MKQNTKKRYWRQKTNSTDYEGFSTTNFFNTLVWKTISMFISLRIFFPVSSFTSLYSLAFLSTCNDRVLYFISNEEKQTPQKKKIKQNKKQSPRSNSKNKWNEHIWHGWLDKNFIGNKIEGRMKLFLWCVRNHFTL